jgi:hypothetical protein
MPITTLLQKILPDSPNLIPHIPHLGLERTAIRFSIPLLKPHRL